MSYVNKKTRAFKVGPDTELNPRRSEGRIKTYPSATDARSWCDTKEDRRQHILEVIRRDYDVCTPRTNHVPVGVVIQMLLANKKNEIQRLQKKIDELETKTESESVEPRNERELSAVFSKSRLRGRAGDSEEDKELKSAREECDELKARVKRLEEEKAALAKKVEECECQMQNQKNRIKRLSRQRPLTAPSVGREAPSERVEAEPRAATNRSVSSDESNRQMMHQLDVLKSKGDSIKTKLEMERRRCNEIITKYTTTVTNMKLQIDVIKRGNCRKQRPLRNSPFSEGARDMAMRPLRNNPFSEGSARDIAICPCAFKSEGKPIGRESDLAEKYKHNCVLLQRNRVSNNCLCDPRLK